MSNHSNSISGSRGGSVEAMMVEEMAEPAVPTFIPQFEPGRLSAKEMILPDRFYASQQRTLTASGGQMAMCGSAVRGIHGSGSGAAAEDGEADGQGSPQRDARGGTADTAAAVVRRQQQPAHNGTSSTVNRGPSCSSSFQFLTMEEQRGLYLRGMRERTRITFRQRAKDRESLQGRSHQALHFASTPCAVVNRPWLVEEDTAHRQQLNQMRDWPHAEWVDTNQKFLERCSFHREECLERLCKRKLESFEVDMYCRFPYCRDPPDCHHDHH